MPEGPSSSLPSTAPQRSRVWLWAALSLVSLRAIPNLSFPIGRDQATYCLIGQGLLQGQRLYRDLWDNKPPGIFYIYALIVKLLGPVMWSVGLVDLLWLLVVSYCVFRFARRSLGAPTAAVAVIFYAAWHCTSGYVHAAQPETFLMLLVFAGAFLLESEGKRPWLRLAAAGLLLGAAFWLKYNAVVFLPLLMFLSYLDARPLDTGLLRVRLTVPWRRWFAQAGSLLVGFAAVLVVVLAYFGTTGLWPAMKEIQFEVLPRYGAMVFERTPHYGLWALERTNYYLGSWTEGMVLATLLIAWKRHELAAVAPVLFAALTGYVCTATQGRFHNYSFETCYPFFAMFWGYVCVKTYEGFKLARQRFARRGWRLAWLLQWVVLANLVFALLPEEAFRVVAQYKQFGEWRRNSQRSYAEYPWPHAFENLHDQLGVIDFLKKNSSPGDKVFVWGTAPLINFLSQRRPASRFVSNLALISPWGPPRWREELVRELAESNPRFIVVARHDAIPTISYTTRDSEQYLQVFPSLAALISSRYQPAVNLWDFEIYRLK